MMAMAAPVAPPPRVVLGNQRRIDTEEVDTHTYAASGTDEVTLPRDRVISEITLDYNVVYDTTTGLTANEDAIARALNAWTVIGSATRNFLTINDMRLLQFQNWLTRGGAVPLTALDVTESQANLSNRGQLVYHPGLNPMDPFDLSGVVPAEDINSLVSQLSWPANTVLGTSLTIDTATVATMGLRGVQGRKGLQHAIAEFAQQDLSLTATSSDLGTTIDVPVGRFIRAVTIMVVTSGNARTNANVTEVGLILPKRANERPFELSWNAFIHRSRMQSGYAVVPGNTPAVAGTVPAIVGVGRLDFSQLVDREASPNHHPYGLDLRTADEGDVRLAFTVGVGSGTIKLLWEQYVNVPGAA